MGEDYYCAVMDWAKIAGKTPFVEPRAGCSAPPRRGYMDGAETAEIILGLWLLGSLWAMSNSTAHGSILKVLARRLIWKPIEERANAWKLGTWSDRLFSDPPIYCYGFGEGLRVHPTVKSPYWLSWRVGREGFARNVQKCPRQAFAIAPSQPFLARMPKTICIQQPDAPRVKRRANH